MDALFTVVSVASIAMLAGAIALQVRTYSRARAVRPFVIVLGQAVSFGSMLLFSIVLARPPGIVEWVLILAAGIAGGAVYGGLVRVERIGPGIVMRYTLPWLLVWGGLMLLTQGAAVATGRLPWVIYSLAILNMAINLGMNGRVIARSRGLRMAGFAAAILVAPIVAGAFAVAPTGVRPVLAANCAIDEVPDLLQGLVPPGGIDDYMRFSSSTDGTGRWPTVHISYEHLGDQIGDSFEIDVYRSADEAQASMASWIAEQAENPVETWVKIGDKGAARQFYERSNPQEYARYWYLGISGAAYVELIHDVTSDDRAVRRGSNADGLFASVMASAGALEPAAVFALATTDSCGGASGTDEPGSNDSTSPGPTPRTGGGSERPVGASGGIAGISDLLDGAPITPGELAGAAGLANGLLLLGALGQFLLMGTGSRPGGTPAPGSAPVAGPPGAARINGTPTGDGRIWYQAPWEDGGPVPTDPAEVDRIEGMKRQGLIYSRTDGWVTPQQGAANEALRAHQRGIERAESDRMAAESHRRIQAARDAQATARQEMLNIDRRALLETRIRDAERAHSLDMAELARLDRVGTALDVAVAAGDLAATGLGIVGGPLGIAVRGGYRVLAGTANGLGTSIADGAGFGETTKRVAIGTVRGAAAAGAELAIDAGARRLFGLPPMFPAAPPAPVIPPSLLAPRAVLRQAVGEAAQIAKTKGIDAAAKTVDPAKVLRLYRNGGMATLAKLEEAGAVSATEAQIIRKVLSSEVNGAVAAGTRDAAAEFGSRTGVRLTEVLVGDSGSSAAGKAGSLVTDADRTIFGVFHPDDVAAYARQHSISPAEAAARLNKELTRAVEEKVAGQLGARGVTTGDIGYSGYAGFGAKAGPMDSYAAGFTRTRQAIQGDTLVVRPDGTTYRAGRDAILDAEGLAARAHGGALPPVQPSVPLTEFEQLGGRQVESLLAHADPKSVAKAVDRVSYLAGRAGIPVDATVTAAAKAIRAEPQRMGEILEHFGLTAEEFQTRALDTSQRFMSELGRIYH